ncbi:site-specific recombinase, phage integrase family [Leptospira weilii serovar Ranarum str. ICFT]|uniref:Site-specific recombinase, phage integrase family n=1 Tax=Leptospira weilii serovar Ranarum str. ICFT TaxID=1218598 RepID=N1W9V9_9LEPT|nr:tyrosine-type recombinase/integrase [Leptospira weilii]EMY76991.1 site-specific recombinase, phage integrase family [Leptospira weilii serovar Ranarum str. ICFT]
MSLEKKDMEIYEFEKILTDFEIRSLIEAVRDNPDHFVMIRVLIVFGLKPEELISLRCGDVDLENKLLKIRGPQGRSDRYLKISPFSLGNIYGAIRGRKPEEYLFPGRKGKLHPKTIQKLFEKLKRKTGIEASCSKIRETIAVQLHSRGYSIKFIGEFLGLKTRRAVYKLIGKRWNPKLVRLFSLDEIMDIGT